MRAITALFLLSSVAYAGVPNECFSEINSQTNSRLTQASTQSLLESSYTSTMRVSRITGCTKDTVISKVTVSQVVGLTMSLSAANSTTTLDLTIGTSTGTGVKCTSYNMSDTE
jgi:hypothetical protein